MMKKLITFVIIFLAGFSAIGQVIGHSAGIPPALRTGNALPDQLREYREKTFTETGQPFNPSDLRYNWDTVVLYDTAGPTYKFTRSLDAQGNVLSALTCGTTNGEWIFLSRANYTYDARGNQVAGNHDRWVNGAWEPMTRDTMSYDASGKLTEDLFQRWDSGGWTNSARYFVSYDARGDTLTEGIFLWTDGAWAGEDRITYTRDEQGKILTELWEGWDNGGWSGRVLVTRTYDDGGKLLLILVQTLQNGTWVNLTISTLAYDNESRLCVNMYETWDEANLRWISTQRQSSSYDADSNPLAVLTETWDSTGQAWTNFSRFSYTCDGNGNSTDAIYEVWRAGGWVGGSWWLNIISQNKVIYTFWFPHSYSYHASFRSYISGLDETGGSLDFSLYPNPAGEKITVECKTIIDIQEVAIYDMLGRLVRQSTLADSKSELDISRLAPGNYLLRLGLGTGAGRAVFVKQ
jgi:hypothetical protein